MFTSYDMAKAFLVSHINFSCYFTQLKARELSRQNMRTSENIGHIVLETVR